MKTRMLPALILTFCAFAAAFTLPRIEKAGQQLCPDPDVVALWHMNEGTGNLVVDQTDNHNDGTIYGAEWVEGKFGRGLYFNGNAYVNLGNGPSLNNLTDFTIEAWIKPSQGSLEGRAAGFAIMISKYGLYQFDLQIWYGHLFGAFGLGDWYWAHSVDLLEADVWTYAVFTHQYSGHVRKLYINGAEVSTIQSVGGTGVRYGPLFFGNGSWSDPPTGWEQAYIGALDEVRITKRVLSSEEILNYYNSDSEHCAVKISANIDLDPDTLNLQSKGKWITGYIELPDGFDVADTDLSTIKLEGTVPAQSQPAEIGDYDGDGIPDLMVKFDRLAVQALLQVGETNIAVTGKLSDGTSFEGAATIRVIDPAAKK